jgi:hypothetical protein
MSTIAALEYRRAVGRYVDWTVTAIDEGNAAEQAQRRGHAAVADPFLNQKMELGMGAGWYFNAKVPDGPGALAQGRAGERGRALPPEQARSRRVNWNRVVTDYHRDADLLLLGLGYSF